MSVDLSRFVSAHKTDYDRALSEIKGGKKTSHWMWYIFPQLKGLGRTSISEYYGINDLDEARAFLNDDYLGNHLKNISNALLKLECNDAKEIMGSIDGRKLKSSMTLFHLANQNETVFKDVLVKYFDGQLDYRTLKMLGL